MHGLLVGILKENGMDCTCNGVSSTATKAILVGPTLPEIFEARDTPDCPTLLLETYMGRLRAIPLTKPPGSSWMFGGHFVYCSDSRFPNSYPIPIHDRSEVSSGPVYTPPKFGDTVRLDGEFRVYDDAAEDFNLERFPDGMAKFTGQTGKIIDVNAGGIVVYVQLENQLPVTVEVDYFNESVTWRVVPPVNTGVISG